MIRQGAPEPWPIFMGRAMSRAPVAGSLAVPATFSQDHDFSGGQDLVGAKVAGGAAVDAGGVNPHD